MKFIARKHKGLRIVLDPRIRHKEMGRTITESLTGNTKMGLTVEFHDGFYETDDPKIIKALKSADGYGLDFFSDDKEPDEPSVEAVRAENEKKEYQQKIANKCPYCGDEFKNEKAVEAHMKACPRKPANG